MTHGELREVRSPHAWLGWHSLRPLTLVSHERHLGLPAPPGELGPQLPSVETSVPPWDDDTTTFAKVTAGLIDTIVGEGVLQTYMGRPGN